MSNLMTDLIKHELMYLIAAYSVVWVLFFAYLYSLSSRLNKIQEEIEHLSQVVEKKKQ